MTLAEFRRSLTATQPPPGLTHALAGLWWDAKGDWTRAHESAQQDEGVEGSWVHAYLHRKGGDQGNAAYWYPPLESPISAEPAGLIESSLKQGPMGRGDTLRRHSRQWADASTLCCRMCNTEQ
jgi:hypothetical protein